MCFAKESGGELFMQFVAGGANGVFIEIVDFLGEGEVFGGDYIPGVVGGKAEMHRAIANVDIGMMIGGFGQFGNLQDQRECLHKIGALDRTGEGAMSLGPAGRNCLSHLP